MKQRDPELKVIAVVGDSFTWGQGLKGKELRFTDRLGKMLGSKVKVLNFGMGGVGTREEISSAIPQVKKVYPDIVLLCYLSNDIHDGMHLINFTLAPPNSWQKRLRQASPLYNYIYYRLLSKNQFAISGELMYVSLVCNYLDSQTMHEHEKDICSLVGAVKEINAHPVAVILPFSHMWRNINPEYRQLIYTRISQSFRESGAPVIELFDLEMRFPPGKFEVSSVDGHPNDEVHKAIAEGIFNWMKKNPEAWQD